MIRFHSRTAYCLDTDEGDVEITFRPYCEDDVLVKRIDDVLVVAYLVHDDDCDSPLTSSNCQGNIWSRNQRLRIDDEIEVRAALGLDSGGRWAFEDDVPSLGASLGTLARENIFNQVNVTPEMQDAWFSSMEMDPPEDDSWKQQPLADWPTGLYALRAEIEDAWGHFAQAVEREVDRLGQKHWRELADPYVVPLAFSHDGRCWPTTWDGDEDDMPDGVWVADAGARSNLPEPDAPEFAEKLLAYAKSVTEEYSSWVEGDVYGCVVEVFDLKDPRQEETEWVPRLDHDSCWGFIGHSYARDALESDFFNPTVSSLSKQAAEVSQQS